MKKIIAVFVILAFAALTGCAKDKIICQNNTCRVCPAYGFANEGDRCADLPHEVSTGSVIWAVLLCETIVAPVLILGWNTFEVDCDATLGCKDAD